jgi:hypothetical protein
MVFDEMVFGQVVDLIKIKWLSMMDVYNKKKFPEIQTKNPKK